MAEASIPVDLLNPGQVFACLGFLEFASELLGKSEATFDWRDRQHCRFWLRTAGDENPFAVAVKFLSRASATAVIPFGSPYSTSKWKLPSTTLDVGSPIPYREPSSPEKLPVIVEAPIHDEGRIHHIILDHWGDTSGRDPIKFWGGSGGYPGAARARDALRLVQGRADCWPDPFNFKTEQSSSFRFDWRRDYIPMDIGFSLNKHGGRISTLGYPFVELLAALGLRHARPRRIDKVNYRYHALGKASSSGLQFFPPNLFRATLGGTPLPFETRAFRMRLGFPGDEKEKAITTVIEESSND